MSVLAALLTLALAAGAAPDIVLTAQKPITRSIDAYPRIASPATTETARINADLAKGDARVKNAGRDCNQDNNGDGQWNRTVSAPFRYGDLLTIASDDQWSCPAFSGTFFTTLTYDLKTGDLVNWADLFPARIAGDQATHQAADTTPLNLVASPILNEVYRRKALLAMDSDARDACADAFQRDYNLLLWLDAERQGVGMRGIGFPKNYAPCALDEMLSLDDLALLKAQPRLIEALKAAHADHGWTGEILPAGAKPRPAAKK